MRDVEILIFGADVWSRWMVAGEGATEGGLVFVRRRKGLVTSWIWQDVAVAVIAFYTLFTTYTGDFDNYIIKFLEEVLVPTLGQPSGASLSTLQSFIHRYRHIHTHFMSMSRSIHSFTAIHNP